MLIAILICWLSALALRVSGRPFMPRRKGFVLSSGARGDRRTSRHELLIRNYLGFSRGLSGAGWCSAGISRRGFSEPTLSSPERWNALPARARRIRCSDRKRRGGQSTGSGDLGRCLVPTPRSPEPGGAQWSRGVLRSERLGSQALTGLRAGVVGAGNSAGQAALHLARYCARVHMIVRGSNLEDSMSACTWSMPLLYSR